MLKARLKRQFYKTAGRWTRQSGIGNQRNGPLVLIYHGVEKELINPHIQTLHIPLRTFEKQMEYLGKNSQVISLDDLSSCLSDRHSQLAPLVLITFDDGYKNNRSLAAPLLQSLGLPFSVFVSTRYIGDRRRFPIYRLRAAIHYAEKKRLTLQCLDTTFGLETETERNRTLHHIYRILKTGPQRLVEAIVQGVTASISEEKWQEIDDLFCSEEPMDWSDVKHLSESGAIIGSHCHDHFILHSLQEAEDIDYQLRISKELIEQNTGRCSYIAYPNGGKNDITPDALERVRNNHYLLGFTSVKGVVRNDFSPLLLPRVFVTDDFDQFTFRLRYSSLYSKGYSRWARRISGAATPG